ncbi:MAG: ABC transporter permease, partial [Firmicutes bacterium]|nr:ABC transporter permease [Bacillota bacterium]
AKKEFGILKAIGYRNGQLVMQLMLSLLPSFILGATIGIILGFTLSNPMLSIMFAASGLLRTTFIVPGLVSVLIALGILGISITATYLIALRLRGISPQKLIVD